MAGGPARSASYGRRAPSRSRVRVPQRAPAPPFVKLDQLGKSIMTLNYIFSQNYLFDSIPPQASRLYIPLLILFSLCLILAVIMHLPKNLDPKIKSRNFYAFLVPGVAGCLYLFTRYESLSWLSSRFFLLLIIATLLVWNIINLIWMTRYIPREKERKLAEERFRKYLPQSKKK